MHRHTDRQVGRRTGEQMQTQMETQHRHMHRLQGEQTQIDKQTDYQTDRLRVQTDRQTGTDKQTVILNGGDWLWSLANIKEANKDAKIYVGRSTTVHVHNFLFCAHALCINCQHVSISKFLSTEYTTIVFCTQSRPKKRTNIYNKELCRVSWPFPSTNYG